MHETQNMGYLPGNTGAGNTIIMVGSMSDEQLISLSESDANLGAEFL